MLKTETGWLDYHYIAIILRTLRQREMGNTAARQRQTQAELGRDGWLHCSFIHGGELYSFVKYEPFQWAHWFVISCTQ